MSNPTTQNRRQPKLRSSCDGCGAAKLKCDRGQPVCGRCVSLGMSCVYGASRKNGRPPRQSPHDSTNIRLSTLSPLSHSNEQQLGNAADNENKDTGSITCIHSDARNTLDSDANAVMVDFDSLDRWQRDLDLLGSSPIPLDFTEPGFANLWNDMMLPDNRDKGLASTSDSPEFKGSSSAEDSTTCHAPHQALPEGASIAFPSMGEHDCFREAHDILGNLSIFNVGKGHFNASPETASQAMRANSVPLDHLLRINREASEQLARVLTLSCNKSSYLQLLYASIISRILMWYQQATDCNSHHDAPSSWGKHAPTTSGTTYFSSAVMAVSHQGEPTATSTGPDLNPNSSWTLSTQSSVAEGTVRNHEVVANSTQQPSNQPSARLVVAPALMAIGTFNVDDLGMQAALKIQLLSGEMKRAGHLIDLFSSFHSGGQFSDIYTFGDVNSLYQTLDSWLRGEHSRITSLMRAKLRELNADLL